MLYYLPYIFRKYHLSIVLLYLFVILCLSDIVLMCCAMELTFVMMMIVYCVVMGSIVRCGWVSQETLTTRKWDYPDAFSCVRIRNIKK